MSCPAQVFPSRLAGALIAGLLALPPLTLPVTAEAAAPAVSYDACVAKVNQSPTEALKMAENWAKQTKAPGADHCAAMALAALGRFDEAAARLENLIKAARQEGEAIALYDQLGLLRLDQGRVDLALDAYTRGLGRFSKALPLLTGRARAYAVQQQWPRVVKDLTLALAIAPDDPRLLLLDATALRRGGQPDEAKPLIERALSVAPETPDLLLERGNIRWELKDSKGAVADWTRVTEVIHSGSIYDAAQRNLDSFKNSGKP